MASCIVVKRVLCGTEYRLQKIVQNYLQIGAGDFTPVVVDMRSILYA